MEIQDGSWNAGRVFQAFGRIGYHPVSALLAIIDNSVSAGATSVLVKVDVKREERFEGQRGRARAVLNSLSIIDNGCGMDAAELHNALTLGSSTEQYHEHTLSKFGMGLKTAALSLGKGLEIISRTNQDLNKVVLDLDLIDRHNKYVYGLAEPTEDDLRELDACTQERCGTLIRITNLHTDSLPRASEIIDELKRQAGVIYYYYLKGIAEGAEHLSLKIDDHDVAPIDPLFVDRIDADNSDLNEHKWDGLQPKWITKSQAIQLDTTGSISARVEITQLPHPPSVHQKKLMSRSKCRAYYHIGAGNYGFYIYRNWRLISWAASLGFVPQDQDLYAFRGRLLINSNADDVLNIDVTKSRIHLSEIAQEQLSEVIPDAVKKSRIAWKTAHNVTVAASTQGPHDTANQELNRISLLQDDDEKRDEAVAPSDERKQLEQRRTKAVEAKPITAEDQQRVDETGYRVLYVDTLENNQLWERAHDPTHGLIVRVNRSHSFCRNILDVVSNNSNLLKIVDVLFFTLARGEYDLVHKSEQNDDEIEEIMTEYRERVGGTLLEIIRRLDLTDFLADV